MTMVSGPITSWQIGGEAMEIVTDFLFLGSKIIADGNYSRERNATTNIDRILKRRAITLLTKVHLVKATVFPVVIYGCESWILKKVELWRIDAFERWCWRRLLRVPWTSRRSNQSIVKEISPGYSLEGLMLKLKLQYFDHLMRRTDSLEKDPDAGKDWRPEEKGMTEDDVAGLHHRLNAHEFEQGPGVVDGQGNLVCCSPWGCRVWCDWATELNWIKIIQDNLPISR